MIPHNKEEGSKRGTPLTSLIISIMAKLFSLVKLYSLLASLPAVTMGTRDQS